MMRMFVSFAVLALAAGLAQAAPKGKSAWTPDDVGRAWVFERSAHEPLGRSVFRLSLGFATAGLTRLRAEPAARALSALGIEAQATPRREPAAVGSDHAQR